MRVGDEELVDAGRRRQEAGVEPPDPAGAEQGDLHGAAAGRADRDAASPARRNDAARTRRPIAALSDGGGQPLSCSTMSQPS